MSDSESQIECACHGRTPSTFVCEHLQTGAGCGFHDSGAEDDPWPDAWCDSCNVVLERDGEWTDDNSPELAILCTGCYERVRESNRRVPAPLMPGQLAVDDALFAALAHASCERAGVRQEKAKALWGFGAKKRWFFDDEKKTLRFYDHEDGPSVVADVVITGSFSTNSNTWLWAWCNENYSDEDRLRVNPLRVFGEVRGIEKFAEGQWDAEEVDGWEVTQIAADLLGAEAIYRMPDEHLMVFMLLNNFRLESAPN